MTARHKIGAALCLALLASACSVGVKRTPGMKLYAAGDKAAAVQLLEQEVRSGEVAARYPLGLAYRDGTGVSKDMGKAEILLTGAAIGGDPRAVSALRDFLETAHRCPADATLRSLWGQVGTMNRNLVTGVVELKTSPPVLLRQMADLYDNPCAGAPAQPEAARSLRGLSSGPRTMWIYVPG